MRNPRMPLTRDVDRVALTGSRLPTSQTGSIAAIRLMLISGLLTCASAAVAAEPLDASNLTLTAAVDLAVRDNPGLKSLRARQAAMQERPAQARALPNPMFTYSGMDAGDGGDFPDTMEKRYMVQQPFPWFGK